MAASVGWGVKKPPVAGGSTGGMTPVPVNGGPAPVPVNGAPSQGGGGGFGIPSLASLQGLAGGFSGGNVSPGIDVGAQTNPALDALLARSTANLDRLSSGGGELMDTAAGRIRDIREGGRSALTQSEGMRGVSSSGRLGDYEGDTSRAQIGRNEQTWP